MLLLAYAVAATGLPIAAPRAKVASLERFPCENCSCGCSTAEHCWSQCCCHTLAERLAWAAKEQVRPPQQALRQALRAGLDVRHWLPGAPAPRLLATTNSTGQKCCCCCRPTSPPSPAPVEQEPASEPAWQSLLCGASFQLWMAVCEALPARPDATFFTTAFDWVGIPLEVVVTAAAPPPPTPPPECWS